MHKLLIIVITLLATQVLASTELCSQKIADFFQVPTNRETLNQFIDFQSKLTLHKFSLNVYYQFHQTSAVQTAATEAIKERIQALIAQNNSSFANMDESQRRNYEAVLTNFREAPMSSRSLIEILPPLAQALAKQRSFPDKTYNLNTADLKMLSLMLEDGLLGRPAVQRNLTMMEDALNGINPPEQLPAIERNLALLKSDKSFALPEECKTSILSGNCAPADLGIFGFLANNEDILAQVMSQFSRTPNLIPVAALPATPQPTPVAAGEVNFERDVAAKLEPFPAFVCGTRLDKDLFGDCNQQRAAHEQKEKSYKDPNFQERYGEVIEQIKTEFPNLQARCRGEQNRKSTNSYMQVIMGCNSGSSHQSNGIEFSCESLNSGGNVESVVQNFKKRFVGTANHCRSKAGALEVVGVMGE